MNVCAGLEEVSLQMQSNSEETKMGWTRTIKSYIRYDYWGAFTSSFISLLWIPKNISTIVTRKQKTITRDFFLSNSDSEEDRPDREPDLRDRGRRVLQADPAGGLVSGWEQTGETSHASCQTHILQREQQPPQNQGCQSQCFQGTRHSDQHFNLRPHHLQTEVVQSLPNQKRPPPAAPSDQKHYEYNWWQLKWPKRQDREYEQLKWGSSAMGVWSHSFWEWGAQLFWWALQWSLNSECLLEVHV